MLRKARVKYSREIVDGFRMRGQDVTRLESFSDAVFGFALTLLVVSLEVPKSFADLLDAMKGFPGFLSLLRGPGDGLEQPLQI